MLDHYSFEGLSIKPGSCWYDLLMFNRVVQVMNNKNILFFPLGEWVKSLSHYNIYEGQVFHLHISQYLSFFYVHESRGGAPYLLLTNL